MTKLKLINTKRPVQRENNILLISGDGKTLHEDLDSFYEMGYKHDAMAVGRSIQLLEGHDILHYAEVDAEPTKWVIENLQKNYKLPEMPFTHTIGEVEWFDANWDLIEEQLPAEDVRWYGSTALFAAMIGLELGYDRIILAGCPMDSKGHWYFPEETNAPSWNYVDYQEWFEFSEYVDSVRSMSGYTKIILGKPGDIFLYGFPKRATSH